MQRERGVRGGSKKRLNPKGTGNGEKGGGCLFHLLRHKNKQKHKHKFKHAFAHKHTQCAPSASTQDRGSPWLLHSICCTHAAAWASLPTIDFETDTREAANALLARIWCRRLRLLTPCVAKQARDSPSQRGRTAARKSASCSQTRMACRSNRYRPRTTALLPFHLISSHPILSPCALYLSPHHCPPNSGVPSSPERVFAAAR